MAELQEIHIVANASACNMENREESSLKINFYGQRMFGHLEGISIGETLKNLCRVQFHLHNITRFAFHPNRKDA